MCTMWIPGSVCRRKPVKYVRDKTLDGLPSYVKEQCATPSGRRAYLNTSMNRNTRLTSRSYQEAVAREFRRIAYTGTMGWRQKLNRPAHEVAVGIWLAGL